MISASIDHFDGAAVMEVWSLRSVAVGDRGRPTGDVPAAPGPGQWSLPVTGWYQSSSSPLGSPPVGLLRA